MADMDEQERIEEEGWPIEEPDPNIPTDEYQEGLEEESEGEESEGEEYGEEGSEEKVSEEDEGSNKDKVPPYLLDTPPDRGIIDGIKWELMHGKTEEQLVAEGQNKGNVRNAAFALEKAGFRKRTKFHGKELAVTKGSQPPMKVWASGSPPEAIIGSIQLGIDSTEGLMFERGLKSGASLVVLGVRIAQELSSIGIGQAKPVMEMARAMREGEIAASKNAANDAAQKAAEDVAGVFGPMLDRIESSMKPAAPADPMKGMMVGLFQNMIGQIFPGLPMPKQAAGGWTVEEE